MHSPMDAVRADRDSLILPKDNGVALCFKVPLSFRRWFKLQALSRNLTMTEFLIKAVETYAADAQLSSKGGSQSYIGK